MTSKRLPFDQAEYDRRLLMTRMAMALAGLDALFVSDPANMQWLTGYDAWTFNHHQGAIILQDADPIWWGRQQDTQGAMHTVWMPEGCVIGYESDLVRSMERHPIEDLARHINVLGVQNLGIEMDSQHFSAKGFSVLLQVLPDVGFADATGMVNLQRAIKSAPEIEFMRKAAAISDKVMEGFMKHADVGMAKNQLVALAYHDAMQGVDGAWGDYPAMPPMLSSGSDPAAGFMTWSGSPLVAGEDITFSFSGCCRRYHAPLCRTIFIGEVSDEKRCAEAALIESLDAGIAAATAGSKVSDVAKALAGPLGHGDDNGNGFGGLIGVAYPPRMEDEVISLNTNSEAVLEPNMTFYVCPTLSVSGANVGIGQSIRISEDGAPEVFGGVSPKFATK
ncbi:Xaa-Pro peptidase family protein [Ascidiaceihabitans sp.]|nr:Xaa-Pro peptidase family protein [Ascidiaceihabitans sp.]